MNFGMMWFDNDPKTALRVKIIKAAEYYQTKYGKKPDLCMVNPKSLSENITEYEQITVRPQKAILPGYLWIGQDEKDI